MTTAVPFYFFFFQNESATATVNLTEWPPMVMDDLMTPTSAESGVDVVVDQQQQPDTALDLVASLLVGLFLAVIIFLSVAGNLLVCIAVYTDRTLRKVGNLFIVSLAISDLFVACLVMVFAVANDLQGFWVFGPQFCDIWVAFDVMCSTASILNLCAISMDRYIHIKDPLRYGRWMTKQVIYGSIAGIWCLAALISFLPVSMGLHKPHKKERDDDGSDGLLGSTPSVNVPEDPLVEMTGASLPQCALDLTPTYAIVSSCISFYLPCLVMLAIYSRLFFYARMHVQNIKAVTRPVILLGRFEPAGDGDSADHAAPTEPSPKNQKRRHSPGSSTTNSYHVSDHKAAITLGIIMGVFLICWVPFFCVNIVAAFCKTCIPPIVFKFLTWLGYSNSAFNPIIYSIFNLEFRLAFQKILTSQKFCCCCMNSNSSSSSDIGHSSQRLTTSGSARCNTALLVVQHHMDQSCTNGGGNVRHHPAYLHEHRQLTPDLVLDGACGRTKRHSSGQNLLVAERVV